MADLQSSVVSDPETRAQLAVQMLQWEENLERLHCEQFRLRCYMASLQSGELPNPKVSLRLMTGKTPEETACSVNFCVLHIRTKIKLVKVIYLTSNRSAPTVPCHLLLKEKVLCNTKTQKESRRSR